MTGNLDGLGLEVGSGEGTGLRLLQISMINQPSRRSKVYGFAVLVLLSSFTTLLVLFCTKWDSASEESSNPLALPTNPPRPVFSLLLFSYGQFFGALELTGLCWLACTVVTCLPLSLLLLLLLLFSRLTHPSHTHSCPSLDNSRTAGCARPHLPSSRTLFSPTPYIVEVLKEGPFSTAVDHSSHLWLEEGERASFQPHHYPLPTTHICPSPPPHHTHALGGSTGGTTLNHHHRRPVTQS